MPPPVPSQSGRSNAVSAMERSAARKMLLHRLGEKIKEDRGDRTDRNKESLAAGGFIKLDKSDRPSTTKNTPAISPAPTLDNFIPKTNYIPYVPWTSRTGSAQEHAHQQATIPLRLTGGNQPVDYKPPQRRDVAVVNKEDDAYESNPVTLSTPALPVPIHSPDASSAVFTNAAPDVLTLASHSAARSSIQATLNPSSPSGTPLAEKLFRDGDEEQALDRAENRRAHSQFSDREISWNADPLFKPPITIQDTEDDDDRERNTSSPSSLIALSPTASILLESDDSNSVELYPTQPSSKRVDSSITWEKVKNALSGSKSTGRRSRTNSVSLGSVRRNRPKRRRRRSSRGSPGNESVAAHRGSRNSDSSSSRESGASLCSVKSDKSEISFNLGSGKMDKAKMFPPQLERSASASVLSTNCSSSTHTDYFNHSSHLQPQRTGSASLKLPTDREGVKRWLNAKKLFPSQTAVSPSSSILTQNNALPISITSWRPKSDRGLATSVLQQGNRSIADHRLRSRHIYRSNSDPSSNRSREQELYHHASDSHLLMKHKNSGSPQISANRSTWPHMNDNLIPSALPELLVAGSAASPKPPANRETTRGLLGIKKLFPAQTAAPPSSANISASPPVLDTGTQHVNKKTSLSDILAGRKYAELTITNSVGGISDLSPDLRSPHEHPTSMAPDALSSLSDHPAKSTSSSSSDTSSEHSQFHPCPDPDPPSKRVIILDCLDDLLGPGSRSPMWTTIKDPPRKLLLSSSVLQVVNSYTVKDRFLFLFNDILVIAKPVIWDQDNLMETSKSNSIDRKFVIKSVVLLRHLRFSADRGDARKDLNNHVGSAHHPVIRNFVLQFEKDPDHAISALFEKMGRRDDPVAVGQYMFKSLELDRARLGDYLSRRTSKMVLKAYIDSFGFTGLRVDMALRIFLYSVNIPDRTAQHAYNPLDTLLDSFAGRWYDANAGIVAYDKDLTFRLVRAVVQLNGVLHGGIAHEPGPTGYPKRNVTCQDFLEAFRRYDGRGLATDELLSNIYDSVRRERLSQARNPSLGGPPDIIIAVKHSLPTHLTYHIQSEPIVLRIPQPDPQLSVHLYGQGLIFDPPVLTFAKSPEMSFRITGTSIGSKIVTMSKSGPNALLYRGLPQSCLIVVERAFMRNTFNLAFLNHDGVKRRYMFSLDDPLIRHQWTVSLKRQIDAALSSATARSASLGTSKFYCAAEETAFKVLQETLIGPRGLPGPRPSIDERLMVPLHTPCGPKNPRVEGWSWTGRDLETYCQQNSSIAPLLAYICDREPNTRYAAAPDVDKENWTARRHDT